MNMTHTGELGYVFYIPTEFALHVYDELVEAGKVIICPPPPPSRVLKRVFKIAVTS